MRISGHAYSDQGPRSQNEDAHVLAPELGLFAVADGMGGTVGGEVASRLAIETLLRYHQDIARREGLACDAQGATDRMKDSVGMICREVGRACVGTLQDMGTTLAAIQVIGSTVVVAHVGDSRVYRFRDGSLAPLTHDHSFVNELESATGYISADTRAAYGHIL
ncbi:MAG: protein phosphatase 2C domain-containing protein, partial [Myxococcota bacterium]